MTQVESQAGSFASFTQLMCVRACVQSAKCKVEPGERAISDGVSARILLVPLACLATRGRVKPELGAQEE